MHLGGVSLSEVEEIGVSLVADGHDTKKNHKVWLKLVTAELRTRRGRAFRQRCQAQRWYQQSGGRWSWKA